MSARCIPAPAVATEVGPLFRDAELNESALGLLLPEIWRNGILPYLPFGEQQRIVQWTLHEQLNSLLHTVEYELERLFGCSYWTMLKLAMIKHRAVIAGLWLLDVCMGKQREHSTLCEIIVPTDDPGVGQIHIHPIFDLIVASAKNVFSSTPMIDSGHLKAIECRSVSFGEGRRVQLTSTLSPGDAPDAWHHWVESSFQFDCRKTTYNPANTGMPIYVSPSTSLDRLNRGQTSFRCVGHPQADWACRANDITRGIAFDWIDPAVLRAQIRAYTDDRAVTTHPNGSVALKLDVIDVVCDGPASNPHVFRTSLPADRTMSDSFRRCATVYRTYRVGDVTVSAFSVSPYHIEACDWYYRPCIYDVCHPGHPHVHVGTKLVLLIHPDSSAASDTSGSKRAPIRSPTIEPAAGVPSPTKKRKLTSTAADTAAA